MVRGAVTPYVPGQSVSVSFYVDGQPIGTKVASVLAASAGTGRFDVGFSSSYAGLLQVRVAHAASAQQSAFSARWAGFATCTRTSAWGRGASRCACCNPS